MKNLFFVILMSLPGMICAQTFPAEIFFLDGTTRQGYVEWPDTKDSKVKFSRLQGGKAEKLSSNNLDHIVLTTPTGEMKIKRVKYYAGNGWFDVLAEGYLSVYMYTKVSTRTVMGGSRVTSESTEILCKRTDESKAIKIYPTHYPWQSAAEVFAKRFSEYLSDDAEMAQKVAEQREGYTIQTIAEIAEEYNSRR